MIALVVYESMFGNTAALAGAVAEGLARGQSGGVDGRAADGSGGDHPEVEVREVGEAPAALPDDLDLLVVGAPTHAFSLSRKETRAEAHRQGATRGGDATGVREWLTDVQVDRSPVFATFDSRVAKVRHLPGCASRKAARLGQQRGLGAPMARESFYVADMSGPLVEGELGRAREWGRRLAERLTASRGRSAAGR